MIANYGEPKEKAKSATIEVDKLPEGCPAEPEMKKPQVEASGEDKTYKGRREGHGGISVESTKVG
jgi:hypothetical protein